jgi:hypothetical protein
LATLELKLFHLMRYKLLIKPLGPPRGEALFGKVQSTIGTLHALIVMRLLLRYFDTP